MELYNDYVKLDAIQFRFQIERIFKLIVYEQMAFIGNDLLIDGITKNCLVNLINITLKYANDRFAVVMTLFCAS